MRCNVYVDKHRKPVLAKENSAACIVSEQSVFIYGDSVGVSGVPQVMKPALFGWLQIRIAFPSGKRQRRGGQQNVEFSDTYFVRDRSV